jgi:hypothetical protein
LRVTLGVLAGQIASELPGRYAMLPAVVYFLALGGWCSLNFARCREAHCLITGAGFDALTIAALVAVGLDRHWYNLLSLTILPVLVVGFFFEAVWASRRGTTAIRDDARRLRVEVGLDRDACDREPDHKEASRRRGPAASP